MMRLHSKTVFKLNAAFLLFLILSMFVIILNVATVSSIYPDQENITLNKTQVAKNEDRRKSFILMFTYLLYFPP